MDQYRAIKQVPAQVYNLFKRFECFDFQNWSQWAKKNEPKTSNKNEMHLFLTEHALIRQMAQA